MRNKPARSRHTYRKPVANEAIEAQTVHLIRENEPPVVTSRERALNFAREANLDLILVGPNNEPPTVKLGSLYQLEKASKRQAKAQREHSQPTKIIRLDPAIADHDLGIKISRAHRMLDKGCRVRIEARLVGRMRTRPDEGRKVVQRALDLLGDTAEVVESEPQAVVVRKAV